MPASPEDQRQIRALLAGDEAAFVTLVRRYRRPMLAVAGSYVSDPAAAEDVVQETWEAVLTGLTAFEGRSTLKTWMFRILANRARTRGSRDARAVPLSALTSDDDTTDGIVDAARFDARGHWIGPTRRWELDGPEEIAARAQLIRAVEAAADTLPARQRAALLLRDVEDLDPAEIQELLGVNDGAFRTLLHRARGAVRAALERALEVAT